MGGTTLKQCVIYTVPILGGGPHGRQRVQKMGGHQMQWVERAWVLATMNKIFSV